MDPSEWIAGFKATHEQAKAGQLSTQGRARYLAMREELARSLINAQGLTVPDGESARKHFRVAQVFQLEVSNLYKTVTRELSRAGFSALIPSKLNDGEQVSFSLTLSRAQEPIQGQARVVAVVRLAGNSRVSFAICSLNEADSERLEVALFDAVLARI